MKIGVFDSGLGGLSIFRELIKELPAFDYIYLGDNARLPYGGRSAALIYEFTTHAVDFLFHEDCQLIILACNTATANALRLLQTEYLPALYPDRRILGVIRPVVETAMNQPCTRLGILATRATVASQSYPEEIAKLAPRVTVYQQACPLLVPVIEEDELNWEGLNLLIRKYVQPLLNKDIDSLILGCTHYGLIYRQIKEFLPDSVHLIQQGHATAQKFRDYLNRHPEILSKLSRRATRHYYATDLSQRYQKLTKLFLGEQLSGEATIELVTI